MSLIENRTPETVQFQQNVHSRFFKVGEDSWNSPLDMVQQEESLVNKERVEVAFQTEWSLVSIF